MKRAGVTVFWRWLLVATSVFQFGGFEVRARKDAAVR